MSLVLGAQTVGFAQDRSRNGVDIGRVVDVGQVNVQPTAVESTEIATTPARPAAQLTREARQFLAGTTQMTAGLVEQSTAAFQRGLVPFTDYVDQLALVEYVDLRAADLTGQPRSDVYQRKVELLEDAWQRVAYREPGVPGWRSDALLAELALTEARLKLAEANGDVGAVAALKADSAALAEEQYRVRAIDYRTAFATLPMMARSVKLWTNASLALDPGSGTAAALNQDRREYLESVLAETESWSRMDVGIGRADKVAAARLNVDLDTMMTALAAGPETLSSETVSRVSGDFAEMFEHQQEYYRYGTASLYDLAQTCVAWHDVQQLAASRSPDALEEAEVARRGAALRELQSLADNVVDLRGRQAADVTYVRLAGRLDGLDALYGETEAGIEYLP
jgi:hypothetical protein